MTDKLIEEYKRQLADINTAYECVEKTLRYCKHQTISRHLSETLHLLAMSKRDLLEILEGV